MKRLAIYLIGVAGTCWVIFDGRLSLFLSFALNKGDLIFLAGLFAMCCYSISMKWLYRKDDMIVLVFCTLLCGSIWMALALAVSGLPLQWSLIQGDFIFYMAYLVIFATLGSSYLIQKTVVVLGPRRVSAYTYLNPSFVAVLGYFMGEAVPLIILPGILLSAVATVALQKTTKSL